MTKAELIQFIKNDMEYTTGCTEPAVFAYLGCEVTHILGKQPERMCLTISPAVLKNGTSVYVPGTGVCGPKMGIAIGMTMNNPEDHLAVLAKVTPTHVVQAQAILEKECIEVLVDDTPADPLYFKIEAFAGEDSASIIVQNDYANVVEKKHNDTVIWQQEANAGSMIEDSAAVLMQKLGFAKAVELCKSMSEEELQFLVDAARNNQKAAFAGLESPITFLGSALQEKCTSKEGMHGVANKAAYMTCAGGEARMCGLVVPIITVAASGNQGITNFVGVLTVAEELQVDNLTIARALAMSAVLNICAKSKIGRMSVVCGAGIAASSSVGAATVYMLGGSYKQMELCMQSVVGTLGGMFCDGAKVSCAYKLSTGIQTAVQYAYMAMQDIGLEAGVGILGYSIEESFANLGRLSTTGMSKAAEIIVDIINDNLKQRLN